MRVIERRGVKTHGHRGGMDCHYGDKHLVLGHKFGAFAILLVRVVDDPLNHVRRLLVVRILTHGRPALLHDGV